MQCVNADINRKLIVFCVRGGGTSSPECNIDIHSRAPLQPRGALIRMFIQSFICRADQACKTLETRLHTNTQNNPSHSRVNLVWLLYFISEICALSEFRQDCAAPSVFLLLLIRCVVPSRSSVNILIHWINALLNYKTIVVVSGST